MGIRWRCTGQRWQPATTIDGCSCTTVAGCTCTRTPFDDGDDGDDDELMSIPVLINHTNSEYTLLSSAHHLVPQFHYTTYASIHHNDINNGPCQRISPSSQRSVACTDHDHPHIKHCLICA